MNAERMVEFIQKYITNNFKNHTIIMDNGGAHKSNLVKEVVDESNNSLLYSVPYRPKTNAIESFFSQLKHYFDFKDKGVTFIKLKKALKKAMKMVKREHFANYMKYAYRSSNMRTMKKESTRRRKLKNYKI